jgi:TRAP-type uncharacterized transport system substrate-binding protein
MSNPSRFGITSYPVKDENQKHATRTPHRRQLYFSKIGASVGIGILATMFVVVAPAGDFTAYAQAIPKSLEQGGTHAALKQRKNTWTVGVGGGILSGTYMIMADELAQVLNDGDNLRILPISTPGAASNLDDLLYLHGVDVVITQSDVFEYFRTHRKTPNLESKIHYIIRLPISEIHVLARKDIERIEDLRGKKVNFGPAGSASSLTGTVVFQRLGVKVEQALYDNPTALQKLRAGEIAALIRVIGKPIDFFAQIPADSGLHLVPIPFSRAFADHYALGELTNQEYPTLIPEGEKIDTLAVPAVLAVYNWPQKTDRYRRVQRFTEALFTKWDKFLEPQRHPKWRDVNLAATVPGWTRWSVAEQMLNHVRQKNQLISRESSSPLNAQSSPVSNLTREQWEVLFSEFLKWQKQRATNTGSR